MSYIEAVWYLKLLKSVYKQKHLWSKNKCIWCPLYSISRNGKLIWNLKGARSAYISAHLSYKVVIWFAKSYIFLLVADFRFQSLCIENILSENLPQFVIWLNFLYSSPGQLFALTVFWNQIVFEIFSNHTDTFNCSILFDF